MPLPTQSDVHVNRPLTNLSVATIQRATNFIATQAFPIVPVQKASDKYFLYDNAYWNLDDMQKVAPGDIAPGSGYTIDSSNTYSCDTYKFRKLIPEEIRNNADMPINLDREATEYVTLKALLKRESDFVTTFMSAAVWDYDYDGSSGTPGANEVLQWNDSSSTPITDVWAGKASILAATGFEPNTLLLGYQTYRTLINHADIVDRVKYGQTSGPAMVDTSELAQIFKVDRVLVSKAIKNSAVEGATASHDFIVGKDALLVYAAPSPGILQPSGGYTFSWTGQTGAAGDGQRIKRYYLDERSSDVVQIEISFDMKLISSALGAFWDGVVA
jgi:hypothetical protein